MSNYTQAFNGSNFLGQWQQISETLDTIDASRFDTTFKTSLLRFKKVYKFVDGLMQNIERWSQDFGPVVKMDRLTRKTIHNDETKEPFARI